MEIIENTQRTVRVINPAGKTSYLARVVITTDGEAVQPPLGGGGYATLGDLVRAGYRVMEFD